MHTMVDILESESATGFCEIVPTLCTNNDYQAGLFQVYATFLIDWIRTDIASYGHAIKNTTAADARELLCQMVDSKERMFEIFSSQCSGKCDDWNAAKSEVTAVPDTDEILPDYNAESVVTLHDALRFAYCKETVGLKNFKKISCSDTDSAVRELFTNAAQYQCGLVRNLDMWLPE